MDVALSVCGTKSVAWNKGAETENEEMLCLWKLVCSGPEASRAQLQLWLEGL